MVEIRSEIERLYCVKNLGQIRSAWYIFGQKAVWVTSENGDGRAERPRYFHPSTSSKTSGVVGGGDRTHVARLPQNYLKRNEKTKFLYVVGVSTLEAGTPTRL